jgi:hypothetical protein
MSGTGGPEGNGHALVHGAHSERAIAPIAERYEAELLKAAPWTADAAFAPARAALARCEARIVLVGRWLDSHMGSTGNWGSNAASKLRPQTGLLLQLEAQAERLRTQLGLTPLARARLGKNVAGTQVDLARLMQEITEEEETDDA